MQRTTAPTDWQGDRPRSGPATSYRGRLQSVLDRLRAADAGLNAALRPLMERLERLLRPLQWLYRRWQYVRPVLFPMILAAAVVVGFTMKQGRDVLVATAEGTPEHGVLFRPQPWLLAVGLLIFSLTTWYFARLALDAAGHEVKDGGTSKVVRWLPGLLGLAPLLAAAMVFAFNTQVPGCLYLALVCGALLIVAPYLARRVREMRDPGHERGAIMPTLVTTLLCTLGVATTVVFSLPWTWSRVWLPETMGTATIVLFAGAAWIAFGTAVFVQPTLRFKLVPPLLLLLLVPALVGNWFGLTDNHGLTRAPEDGAPARLAERPTPAERLDRWLAARRPAGHGPDEPYPVIVVAAEGGGIRAAYWTAYVLAALEDRHPGFFCHVFAISGVSGGSLGAAVFTALAAEKRAARDCTRPADLRAPSGERDVWNCEPGSGRLCAHAQKILGRDFLAPTTAGMLFPDLAQRFVPYPLLPDRQSYLEQAWEAAWNAEIGTGGIGRMAGDFLGLWEGDGARLPSLLLNTTEVARGGRAIVSNLEVDGGTGGFVDTRDVLDTIGVPIRLATAAGLSARFSYVSPAANTGKPDQRGHALRLVDGGYFENSGALTAHELMEASGLLGGRADVRPIVLAIRNSTVEGLDDGSWPDKLLSESLPPLDAVLHARVARGEHALRGLEAALGGGGLVHVDLPPIRTGEADEDADRDRCRKESRVVRAVPLSWMLAADVKRYVDCMAGPQVREAERRLGDLLTPQGG